MARIRTIKPDAFHSDSLAAVDRGVRWTFAGLWTYCDDEGRARCDIRLIKAALYPLDDDITLATLVSDLDALEAVGCVCRYEVAGRKYLHIPGWEHQKINRPTTSKLPECTASHEEYVSGSEDSVSDHGAISEPSLAERKGKERNREAERASARESSQAFDAFWQAYPRRTDRGHAVKAWAKLTKTQTDPRVVIEAASRFAAKSANTDPKFIPHPATWLNGERWLDEDVKASDEAGTWDVWQMPTPPPEVADDPELYARWIQEQRGVSR